MDQQRFDELTRALAQGRSRRHVLKLLGGLTAGLGAMTVARRGALAGCIEEGNVCTVESDQCCLGFHCDPDLEECVADDVICAGDGDPCATNAGAGVRATAALDCCEGLVCNSNGLCQAVDVCGAIDDDCLPLQANLAPCCEGLVCDPLTLSCQEEVSCADEGQACGQLTGVENELPCCGDLVCGDQGICVSNVEVACEEDADCVAEAAGNAPICCAGFCRALQCCIDDEDPNARCPEGTSCFEGMCDPVGGEDTGGEETGGGTVTLPATGAGAGDGGNGLLGAAALAAGAAALLGAKKLRATEADRAE